MSIMTTIESIRSETTTERDFVISRLLDAAPEVVFEAWTNPKSMADWWGPRDFTNPVCSMDARPGGAYRIVMRSPEGAECPLKGVFREVVRPERLVMTMDHSELSEAWHDLIAPDRAKDDHNPAGEVVSTVTFEEMGARTKLTVRVRFESAEIRNAFLKMGMYEGWSQSLDCLAALLAKS
jgi:uncharacterized protein YndB with AHSA1/START domain